MQTCHDELLEELVALGARISAAEHRHLTLIRELGKCTNPWGGTFAEWIAWRCHVDPKTAYEMIRVADALEHLPIIDKLFAEGRLSYSKVRVITRHADERTDEVWAGHALLMTVRQLNHLVRQFKKTLPQEAIAQAESRYMRISEHEDGGFILRAKLTAEQGALLIKALEAAMNAGGAADSREQANVDALVEIATAALGQLATGDAAKLQVRTESLQSKSDFLHVATKCCSVDGHAIADHVAEHLECQGRRPNTHQMRELKRIHYGTCSHPVCTHKSFLHAHHIEFVSRGGKTTLSNLTLLCSKHHRQLHEGDFTLTRDVETGVLVFKNSFGRIIQASPSAKADTPLSGARDEHGRDIWDGTKPDYNASVELLQTFDPRRQSMLSTSACQQS